jgi:hypothetical protein
MGIIVVVGNLYGDPENQRFIRANQRPGVGGKVPPVCRFQQMGDGREW